MRRGSTSPAIPSRIAGVRSRLAIPLLVLAVAWSPAVLADDPLEEVSGTETWTRPSRRLPEGGMRYSELRRRMMLEAEREEALEEFEQDRYRFARERSEYSWDRAEFIRRHRELPTPARLSGKKPAAPAPPRLEEPAPPRVEPRPAVSRDSLATAPDAGEAPASPPWGPDPAEAGLPRWPAEEEARGPLISGKLFTHLFAPFTRAPLDDSLRQLSASLWVSGKASLGEVATARFTLTGDAFQARLGSAEHFRARIREAYFLYASSGLELRVGQQVLPWGNADGHNPTDFLGARDYAFFASEDELRRLGSLTAQAAWTPHSGSAPFTFTLSWTPIAPRSRLLVPASALPEGLLVLEPSAPGAALSGSSFALKASYLGSGWDASLVGFHGWAHLPTLELAGIDAAGVSVRPVNQRLTAVGGEASFSLEKWIFRVEGVWRATADGDGSDPLVEPAGIDAVAGLERPVGERLRVHAQLLWRHYPSLRSPETIDTGDPLETEAMRGIARANALLHNYPDQNRPATSLRLTFNTPDEDLEISMLGLVNWVGRDWFVRPSIVYRFAETGSCALGVDFYGGPVDRPLGSMEEFRSLFLETKWMF